MTNRRTYEMLIRIGGEVSSSLNTSFAAAEKRLKGLQEASKALSQKIMPLSMATAGVGAASLKAAIDYESAFAGVKKTVSGTPEQLALLNSGIREMAKVLPPSAVEIASVAEAAGQLGISRENILDFSRVMIDMGESTNLAAGDAAEMLARFANVTKMSASDYGRLGSVIVALGNDFATTESDIVEMSMRLAGAGSQLGLSQANIMGISAALSSMGIEAEMGGSAFSKAMITMKVASETEKAAAAIASSGMGLRELQLLASNSSSGFKKLADSLGYTSEELLGFVNSRKNLEDFAKVSGVTADEFAARFKRDAAGAVADFIGGLSRLDEEGLSAIVTLDEMGFKEVRLRDTLLRATNAQELFTRALGLSDQAWKENTALSHEAAQRYETTASKLQILRNNAVDLGISFGEVMLPALHSLIEVGHGVVGWLGQMDLGTRENIVQIGAFVAALGPALGLFSKIVGVVRGLIPLLSGLGGALTALSGPVGWTVAGISTLTAGVIALKNAHKKAYDDTINFSGALENAADNYQAVADKADQTRRLTDEYQRLANETGALAEGAFEAAEAKARMAAIEAELSSLHGDSIGIYAIENGRLLENIELLKQKAEQEKELARMQYDKQYFEAGQKLPDAIKELEKLRGSAPELQEKANSQLNNYLAMGKIAQEWDIVRQDKSLSRQEQMEKQAQFNSRIAEIWGSDYADSMFGSRDYNDALAALGMYKDQYERTSKELVQVMENFNSARINANNFYDAGLKRIEDDLGGKFEQKIKELSDASAKLAELEQAGMGDTEEANAARAVVSDLTPRVAEAVEKIAELNQAVQDVPEVKTIDVWQAVADIDVLVQKLNQLPSWVGINITAQSPVFGPENIKQNADGAIVTRPILTTFAEKSWEAAIPINDSQRSRDLWLRTGELLGMVGGSSAIDSFLDSFGGTGSGGDGGGVTVNFSPNVSINGNANAEQVAEGIRLSFADFEQMFDRLMLSRARKAF